MDEGVEVWSIPGGGVLTINGKRMIAPPDPEYDTALAEAEPCCPALRAAIEHGDAQLTAFQERDGTHYYTITWRRVIKSICPWCSAIYPIQLDHHQPSPPEGS